MQTEPKFKVGDRVMNKYYYEFMVYSVRWLKEEKQYFYECLPILNSNDTFLESELSHAE